MPEPGPRSSQEPGEPWVASIERAKHGSFRELFPADELRLYAVGTLVFIGLALLTRDVVLNWIIGPLFITVWAWYVPVLQARWRERRGGR